MLGRNEIMVLLVIVGVVIGTLEGFHLGGIEPVGLLGVFLSIALVSIGVLHVIPIAEGVFVAEAVVVSVLTPLVIEPSIQFELIGIGIAVAFCAGVVLNRAVERTEPRPD